jgi:maltose alpha-D-glucosyltransferase/alpha-amylase
MVTSKERDYMYRMYAADPRARINLGIRRRLAPLMDNDRDRIKLMNSLLLSMPGSPIIYYGDEIGMGDNVFVGDRNGVRTPMQWSPDRNAGFSRADPQRLYLQPIMDAVYGYQALNVEAQASDASSLLNWTRRMLAVRKTSLAFGRGKRRFLRPGNRKMLAYLSEHDGEALLFVANLARSAQPVELDLARFKGRVPVEMLGRTAFPPIGELPYLLTIAAHGFYWFRLATDTAEPRWHQGATALEDRPVLVLFDGWTSLFRDQVMPWRIGMADRIREQFECETLPRHLAAQRWFAVRGEALQRVRLTDHAVWTPDDASWLLAILTPDAAADDARYFLPLALAWEEHDDERLKGLAIGAVARVRQQAEVGVMGDAFFDEPFCRALVQAIGRGETCATGGGQLRFRPTASFATVCGPDPARGPVGRPLSHGATTVVMIGERLLLRAYHRLRPGINPELELSCYLSEVARFPHCVPVAGTLEHVAGDGTVLSLALLQAYVPNQGNGWAYTQAYLERHLEAWRSNPVAAPTDVHGGYLALMQTLGTRTAELHQALSRPSNNPAFGAEPASADDRSADLARVMATVRDTFGLLATRLDGLGPAARAQAITLLGRREGLLASLQRAAAAGAAAGAAGRGATLKTRLHGDYGLSRVLLTRNDFVIIGFGGNSTKDFDTARAKGSPLRDVAGMLHSFCDARWNALRRLVHTSEDLELLAPLAHTWNLQARQAFLAAYDAAAPEPADAQTSGWLGVFEVAHAIDQLRDELDQRSEGLRPAMQAVLDLSARWSGPGAQP